MIVQYYDRAGRPITEGEFYDLLKDATSAGGDPRHVARTKLDHAEVSTMWLGLDHSFGDEPEPLIFQTAVFGGLFSGRVERYPTEAKAVAGHEREVEFLRDAEHALATLLKATARPAREILSFMDDYMHMYGQDIDLPELYTLILEEEAGR